MSNLPPAPPPSGILEAALYVDDLDAAEIFYCDVLGLEKIQRAGQRHVFFRVGTSVLLVFDPARSAVPGSNPRLPVPAHGTHGPGHVCFFMARAEIDAMRARLNAAGYETEAEFDWPNSAHSLYVRDPAGNSVEFSESWLWG